MTDAAELVAERTDKPAVEQPAAEAPLRLTVLGTTDLHGHVFNWDYFSNTEFDAAGDQVGLAKVATMVARLRAERGTEHTLLIDAGDTIQGTPLAYYYARVEPISRGRIHPMAAAMNQLGYDAAALGNHEFNYGLPLLRTWQNQLDFPLLGANALDVATGRPAFRPYVLTQVSAGAHGPTTVGILGLTNPGIAIWDKARVEGQLRFPGLVEQARHWVPRMREAGADLVIVAAHSGLGPSSSYGDALPYWENDCRRLAELVPGIDAILAGHAHVEVAEQFLTNAESGRSVLVTEPLYWGKRLSVMEFDLDWAPQRGWRVTAARAQVLSSHTAAEEPQISAMLREDHRRVVGYVNSAVGTCLQAMSAAGAVYEDTAVLGFINRVQAETVQQALAGTPAAGLPILSIAAPFNRNAAIPAGQVTVRDVAGLYVFDNALVGVMLTGEQIKQYLEKAAEYFQRVTDPGPHSPSEVTNARTAVAPDGTRDYNFDVMHALGARLTYDIDIAAAPGQRIVALSYDGRPLARDERFVVAVNDYRHNGGGNYPHVSTAEVVYTEQAEVRQLLIDWVRTRGTIDPREFASTDWRLVADGTPVTVEPELAGPTLNRP